MTQFAFRAQPFEGYEVPDPTPITVYGETRDEARKQAATHFGLAIKKLSVVRAPDLDPGQVPEPANEPTTDPVIVAQQVEERKERHERTVTINTPKLLWDSVGSARTDGLAGCG